MLLKTTGEHDAFELPDDDRAQLDALQTAVGGYVEVVPCDGGALFVNEDGLSLKLPPNSFASFLAGRMIVGDVVFCDAATYARLAR